MSTETAKLTVKFRDSYDLNAACGPRDAWMKMIKDRLQVHLEPGFKEIMVKGRTKNAVSAVAVLKALKAKIESKENFNDEDVSNAITAASNSIAPDVGSKSSSGGRELRALTLGQQTLIDAIAKHDVTLCVGPAGSGKTAIPVAMGVAALRADLVKKLIIVRPAVEAGEKLGFLPGDLQEKINPYLRPVLDEIGSLIPKEQVEEMMAKDIIEMSALGLMRGRTLRNAFVILDEAQNATCTQMKMFLTRLGLGSKMVISGDPTQVDLPWNESSGLPDAMKKLAGVEGVAQVELTEADVVRHSLVQKIVKAYENRA